MTATVASRSVVFAGLSGASWAYAIRIWLAVVLALYVSFWLELDSPSSAAITVAILALPTRGQGLEKAAFRLVATVFGVTASIAIVGVFVQTDMIMLWAVSAWIGLCVFTVGMLDGNRAYAASLGVTTVAIVAIQQIDTPQIVFDVGVARGSAIAVGVLAITFVNDILAAPDHHPKVTAHLQALHRQVGEYARKAVHGQAMPALMAAKLLREITALRPDTTSLVTESNSGQARSVAARAAMVGLVAELSAARALEAMPLAVAPDVGKEIAADLDQGADALSGPLSGSLPDGLEHGPTGLMAFGADWLAAYLLQRDRDVRISLDALKAGVHPPRAWRAPLYRSRRIAGENGARAAFYFALASIFFAAAGWPASVASLSFVAIIIGLGSTAPDLRAFTKLAVLVAPVACLLAGILEFVVLDGATGFPMLAIGLAPFIIGCALLMTLTSPVLAAIGRLNMVFIIALVAPGNPQTYDPQTFLFACLFACLATSLLFAFEFLLPPMSTERQIRQLLAEAQRDLSRPPSEWRSDLAPEEALFRNAMRVGQIVTLGGADPWHLPAVEEAMRCFDRAAALRLARGELDGLAGGAFAGEVALARNALLRRDASAMLASAQALREAASRGGAIAAPACAALLTAGVAFTSTPDVASIDKGQS
jgi:uncharacterized membrane protein YccC